jgi:hypothetical protein
VNVDPEFELVKGRAVGDVIEADATVIGTMEVNCVDVVDVEDEVDVLDDVEGVKVNVIVSGFNELVVISVVVLGSSELVVISVVVLGINELVVAMTMSVNPHSAPHCSPLRSVGVSISVSAMHSVWTPLPQSQRCLRYPSCFNICCEVKTV